MIEILIYSTSGFWKFCGSFSIIYIILHYLTNCILRLASRFLRMIMVIFKGWPPNHLDADGDFINKT